MWFFLAACTAPEKVPDSPATEPTTAVFCGEGTVWDGAACVPARCGSEPWPSAPSDAVYVSGDADGYGDGSRERPFAVIADALLEAGAGGTVVIAAGTYPEGIAFTDDIAGISVVGRCPELVILDGEGLDPDTPLVYTLGSPGRRWTLSGVSVVRGAYGGVWVLDGTLQMSTVRLSENQYLGLAVGDADGASLEAEDLEVIDSVAVRRSAGYGLYVTGGSRAQIAGSVIRGNVQANVVVEGAATDLTLTDTLVGGVVEGSSTGVGISVQSAAVLILDGVSVNEVEGIAVTIGSGSTASLTATTLTSVVDLDGGGGLALLVTDGSALTADDLSIGDCDAGGVQVLESTVDVRGLSIDGVRASGPPGGGFGLDLSDTTGSLSDVDVRGVVSDGLHVTGGALTVDRLAVYGSADREHDARGVEVSGAAEVVFTDLVIQDATSLGLAVYGATVRVEGAEISGTVVYNDRGGLGVYGVEGAQITLVDTALVDNRSVGLHLADPGTVGVLDGVTIGLTRSDGAYIFGRGAQVLEGAALDAVSTVFTANQEIGLYVATGSVATLDHVTIEGTVPSATYATGFGLVVQDDGAAYLDSVVLQGNSGPGVYAAYGGRAELFETTVLDNGFAGAAVWDGTLSARSCDFNGTGEDPSLGGGVGVYGVGGALSVVLLEDVIVSGNRYAGLWLTGPGQWSVVDADLMGGGGVELSGVTLNGNAVYATGGAELTVDGGWMRHSQTALLLDGATATVSDTVFEDNRVDVRQQGCEGVDPVTVPDGVAVDRCPAIEELPAPLDFRVTVSDVVAK